MQRIFVRVVVALCLFAGGAALWGATNTALGLLAGVFVGAGLVLFVRAIVEL